MSALRVVEYAEIRDQILPGDMVAYGGWGPASLAIRWWTQPRWFGLHPVSHTGVAFRVQATYDRTDRFMLQTLEAVGEGVRPFRLSTRRRQYPGRIWILPLAAEVRSGLDLHAMFDWFWDADGTKYDLLGAMLRRFTSQYDALYCTETWQAGLDTGGAFDLPWVQDRCAKIGLTIPDPSQSDPAGACRYPIYGPEYWQIAGPPCEIPGYNGGLS